MTLLKTTPTLELRAQAQGLVEGYASVFGGIDSYSDTVVPGAFSRSLSRHKAAGTVPSMLWQHKQDAPIGRWEQLVEDSRGLLVEGRLNLRTNAGQQAFEHLRAGDINGLSIGFSLPSGKQAKNGINVLQDIELHEISAVSIPADDSARITRVKERASKPLTLRAFEEALEDLGFSRKEARNIAAKGFSVSSSDGSNELIQAFKAATLSFKKGNP